MEAILEIFGEKFEVDAALRGSRLRQRAEVHHVGDPVAHRKGEPCANSGFAICISEDADTDLQSQIADVLAFLRQEGEEVKRIRSFAGVEMCRIRFGEIWPLNTGVRYSHFPSNLLAACGQFGIDVVLCQYNAG